MQKKWQRVSSGIAGLAVMSGLVAGCGGSNNTTTTDTGKAGALPTGQHLVVWSWQGAPELDKVKALAQAWATAHGDTVDVVDQSNNAGKFQFFATAARGGKGPDIVFGMPHDNNGMFQQEGLMLPVPDGTINPSDYTQSEIDASTIGGKLYSVPVSAQTTALFYNTDMIKSAPTDWNSFVDDANKYGFMYDQANLYYTYAFIGGLGGYVFKNNNGTLDPNDIGLDNQGAIQAYQLLSDFDNKYHWMTPSSNEAIAKAKFLAGKLGMFISGPWDIGDLNKATSLHYSVTPLPTLSNGQPATPFLGVITAFVSSKSDSSKQAADWDLLKALSNSDAQKQYWQSNEQIPTLTALQQAPEVSGNAYFKAFTDQIKNSVPMPNIPQMQAVWTAMSVLNSIVKGSVTPTDGAHQFVANVKKGIAAQG